MATEAVLSRVKKILREDTYAVFSDDDINFYISENDNDVDAAIYDMLLVKAEDNTVTLPGLSVADTSSYFRKLAQKYRPNNSGVLGV